MPMHGDASPLPPPEEVHAHWFEPWATSEARSRPDFGLQSDVQQLDDLPGPAGSFHLLEPPGVADVQRRLEAMVRAAEADFGSALGRPPPLDASWLPALDKAWPETSIASLMRQSKPDDPANPYLVVVCELGAMLGQVLLNRVAGSRWLHDWPYWESAVWHPASRTRAPVFHWAVRRMSRDGFREPMIQRLEAAAGFMREQGGPSGPLRLPERKSS